MASQAPASATFQITLQGLIVAPQIFEVSGSDTVAMLKDAIAARVGVPSAQQNLVFSGRKSTEEVPAGPPRARLQVAGTQLVEDQKTLSEYEIGPDSIIHLVTLMRKPVIYLYPPEPTQVSVKLSLIPEWRFSVLYPSASVEDIKHSEGTFSGQKTEWNVLARPDGRMTVLGGVHAGVDVSYLFWEAQIANEVVLGFPDSPPASRPGTPVLNKELAFIPGRTMCSPSDSVLIQANEVPTYLNKALQALTLHTEARTSFITFWLPYLLRHQFVALKFISQASFERAAPLDITPRPDVVTRIFMLFQGVKASDIPNWQEAQSRASESPELWKRVVGVEEMKVEAGTFRAVEWGGMEVF